MFTRIMDLTISAREDEPAPTLHSWPNVDCSEIDSLQDLAWERTQQDQDQRWAPEWPTEPVAERRAAARDGGFGELREAVELHVLCQLREWQMRLCWPR